jgi:hypothetical protein
VAIKAGTRSAGFGLECLLKMPAWAMRGNGARIIKAASVITTNENRSPRQYLIARTPKSDGFCLKTPIHRIGRLASR